MFTLPIPICYMAQCIHKESMQTLEMRFVAHLQVFEDGAGFGHQFRLVLHQRKHGDFNGGNRRVELEQSALLATNFILAVRRLMWHGDTQVVVARFL